MECLVVPADATEIAGELARSDIPMEGVFTKLPVVVYADGDSKVSFDDPWRRAADVCTVRSVRSPDHLLETVVAIMHCPVDKLSDDQRERLSDLEKSNHQLSGKSVLIVDDDMRNIFALSAVLEDHDMVISSADNGRDAIRLLRENPRIDVVLMDIMMPEMDGMETMREIRKVPELKNLPIVAVTAKAMKGDREKCIEAGAWDYLSKPVDSDQLLAVLRSWVHR